MEIANIKEGAITRMHTCTHAHVQCSHTCTHTHAHAHTPWHSLYRPTHHAS